MDADILSCKLRAMDASVLGMSLLLPSLVVQNHGADHGPLAGRPPEVVTRENPVGDQQPLGDGQICAAQFFSSSSVA